ncbi:MAG: peptidylprolyl isomerase [Anaerolineales bacterium]|nr:peptidylprolyl isomerase [Anaerolineales bacterium]
MANKPKQPVITKKHLARQERERRQNRTILISGLIVLVVVIGLIGYGILEQTYFKAHRTVATVNGEKIILKDFQTQARYYRLQLVNQAQYTYQLLEYFGGDSQNQSSFANQLYQLQAQLSPTSLSDSVINTMIDEILIRQEAKRRGITVSSEELEKSMQEAFGYFAGGTPTSTPTKDVTSLPTATYNPTQLALAPSTSTPTNTPEMTTTATQVVTMTATPTIIPSITPTSIPTATSTPYTLDGYKSLLENTISDLEENIQYTENDFRMFIENSLYDEKLKEAVFPELSVDNEAEEIWARHILVEDEDTAKDLLNRLENGEDWMALAAEFSTDTSNKDQGGDLGWFGKGQMVASFEDAAFALQSVGEISPPVQSDYGWHIIQLLGRQYRQLSESEYRQLQNEKFEEWMTELKNTSDITIESIPTEDIPTEPAFPEEINSYIQQITGQ